VRRGGGCGPSGGQPGRFKAIAPKPPDDLSWISEDVRWSVES
jgi:hypothetical protein